jgi:hypothetical protein
VGDTDDFSEEALLLLKRRRDALADTRPDPNDPIIASLDELIAELERGGDVFQS